MKLQNSTPAQYRRTFIAFVISMVLYFLTIDIVGSNLDLYGAVIYYINWIENISLIIFSNNVFVETYAITNSNLAAPEPIPGLLIFILTRFSNSATEVLNIMNISVIFLYIHLCSKYLNNKYLFVLLCIALFTGYYEYVLLHMTHRFKIAILFFFISLSLVERHKKISNVFYVLAMFSHLSMLFVLPILYCFQKMKYRNVPTLSFKNFLAVFFGLFVLYSMTDENLRSDYFQQILGRKLAILNLQDVFFENMQYIPLVLLGFYILYKLLKNLFSKFNRTQLLSPKVWLFILLAYILTSLIIVGTSRLLMVYYICILFIIVVNWKQISLHPKNVVLLSFIPVFIYSLFNGIFKGPIYLIIKAVSINL